MTDMSTDTKTLATDREWVEIEGKARANTVLYWPELIRLCNRLRASPKVPGHEPDHDMDDYMGPYDD